MYVCLQSDLLKRDKTDMYMELKLFKVLFNLNTIIKIMIILISVIIIVIITMTII